MIALSQCAPNVAAPTINAIIQVESGGNPLAINVNGIGSFSPKNLAEAIAISSYYMKQGRRVDLGLMQIDSANLPSTHQTLYTIFDPCTNISAGSSILSVDYTTALTSGRHGANALDAALSAYNTGSLTAGFYNGYLAKYHILGWTGSSSFNDDRGTTSTTLYERSQPAVQPGNDDTTLYKMEK